MGGLLFSLFLFLSQLCALTNSHPSTDHSSNFVVEIRIPTIEKNGEKGLGYCNGSIVSENLVLTSAHCLIDSTKLVNQVKVFIGRYETKHFNNGSSFTGYYVKKEIHAQKFYFHPDIEKRVLKNKLETRIPIAKDWALISLKESVANQDLISFPSFVTRNEYQEVIRNSESFAFVVQSINTSAHVETTSIRRYAYFLNPINLGVPYLFYKFLAFSSQFSKLEAGDSGAPLLVNINGLWKIVGISKGEVNSALLEKIGINLYQKNIFTPFNQDTIKKYLGP